MAADNIPLSAEESSANQSSRDEHVSDLCLCVSAFTVDVPIYELIYGLKPGVFAWKSSRHISGHGAPAPAAGFVERMGGSQGLLSGPGSGVFAVVPVF